MQEIQDLSWMKQLIASSKQEHLMFEKYRLVLFAAAPTALRRLDRFRYRALFFEDARHRPFLTINLESTILGDFCLTIERSSEHTVLARFDAAPSYAFFRETVLSRAKEFIPAKKTKTGRQKPANSADGNDK
jgi:hypothetical protein